MKINELRIGNYVQSTKDTCLFYKGEFIVGASEFNKFYMHGMKYIEPIPLAEDWLVKFGFEFYNYEIDSEEDISYNETGVYKSYKIYKNENIYYSVDINSDNSIDFCIKVNWSDYILLSQIESVHQLQNLYFALTGEELTIKNK